jgi:hypothetical protein
MLMDGGICIAMVLAHWLTYLPTCYIRYEEMNPIAYNHAHLTDPQTWMFIRNAFHYIYTCI